MAFRTVFTVVGTESGDPDLTLAAALCEETGAHLSVMVLQLASPPPIGEFAAIMSDPWLEDRRLDLEAVQARVAAITALLAARGISCDVTSAYPEAAWADETVARRARYADITVIGPQLASDADLAEKVLMAGLFASGKPLLLVPAGAKPSLKPKRIVIGWDARLEASRAVREALDMLVGAEEVRLVLVDPKRGETGHGEEPGADAAAYLARHGVKVTVDRLPAEGRSVAEVLKRHARDTGADLLVMGGYGHSRTREAIFGGATRHVLDHMTLPVLMSH